MKNEKIGCIYCKHFHQFNRTTCDAYPDGIPAMIAIGNVHHTVPLPNDGGIQFEPMSESDLQELRDELKQRRETS